jgi:hypothetical protein
MEAATCPPSFASRLILPGFSIDLIIHDERPATPARDEYNFLIPNEPPRRQHEWIVRTVVDVTPASDYVLARERAFILDVIHPYALWELKDIITHADGQQPYVASAIPHHPIYPLRHKLPKRRTGRTSQRWTRHTGTQRRILAEALQLGAAQIATRLWDDVGPRYEATGYISPSSYNDHRVEWEWERMTKPHVDLSDDDSLTLDDLPSDE